MLSSARLGSALGRLRGSLRARMVAWFFVPTAIILVAVALHNFYAYQRVTEELVIERDRDVTRLAAGQLTTELAEFAGLLDSIARTADISQGNPASQQAALKRTGGPLVVFDGGLVVLDTFGRVVAAEPERPEILGQDWSGRDYFAQLVHTSRPAFSDVLADGPGQANVVVAAVPITGGRGEFLGAVLGMFRLGEAAISAFYGEIVKLRIAESGDTYLVDGNSRVIYHSDATHIGSDFSGQPVVRRVLDGQVGAVRTQDFDGRDIVAGFAPVPGTSWGFITEESWAALTSASRGDQRFLLLLLALGVTIPGLFVVIGLKRVMRPVEDLIGAAREVARGNFSQTITSHSVGEIEELAREFNFMAAQLQESYELLEQRVAERTKELHESRERLNTVVTGAPVVLFAMDKDGVFTFSEGRGLDTLGLMPGEVVGQSAFDIYADVPEVGENIRRTLEGEERTATIELDGQWFETRYSPIRDENSQVIGVIGVATDVTERIRAEEALRESEERLRSVVTSAPVVLFAMNSEGRITFAEGQGFNAFGFNPSEVVGESVFDANHNEDERLAENFKRAINGEEFTHISDMGELTLEARYSPIRDESGEISGVIAVAFDITERRRAEEALRQYAEDLSRSNADLEQFAYVASHDLQEPLRAIVGFTKMLARSYEGKLGEDADDYISRIVNASGRMQALIIDLLEYSRVGRGLEELRPTNCESVFRRVIDSLHAAIEERGAVVTHDPLPTVMADPTMLGQVFSNLIANAIKFKDDGPPHVHVSANRLDGEWLFSVQDDGIGMEPQYAERIFVIFQRLHARTEYEGTGIGLAICKKAVERLGGRIWVESQPGEGATFHFTIPISGDRNGATVESPRLVAGASPLPGGDRS